MNRKGFTLLEVMVVLILFGILVTMVSYYTKDNRIPQTKAERLANAIRDTVVTARNNMLIGRGVAYEGGLVPVPQRYVYIKTGALDVKYPQGGSEFSETGTLLAYRFFDDDQYYIISNIAVSSGSINEGTFDASGALQIRLVLDRQGDMYATGTNAAGNPLTTPIRSIMITASYQGYTQPVIIDRVSGTIELAKSGSVIYNPLTSVTPPPTPPPPSSVNGACGAATLSIQKPTSNLCSFGTKPSEPIQKTPGGIWEWNCDGLNGGSSMSCRTQTDSACVIDGKNEASKIDKCKIVASPAGCTIDGNGPESTLDTCIAL